MKTGYIILTRIKINLSGYITSEKSDFSGNNFTQGRMAISSRGHNNLKLNVP